MAEVQILHKMREESMNEVELSDVLHFKDLLRLSRNHDIEVITYDPFRIAIPERHGQIVKFYEVAHIPNSLFPVMVCYLSHPKLDYIR
jgi:hypothetical protein